MELAITFHGTVYHIGAWIFYVVVAALASYIAGRNSRLVENGSARFSGAFWGVCLAAALHLYPSGWAWLFAALTVLSTILVMGETDLL